MKIAILSIAALSASVALANQFVDDYGKVHILFNQPKIICSAHTAAALFHLGMDPSWLAATWGGLYNRASGIMYGEEGEYATMDASPEDMATLRRIPSFSVPGCLDPEQIQGDPSDIDCWGGEYARVKAFQGDADLIIDISNYHDDFVANVSSTLGIPVVKIDSSYDGAINCQPDPEDPDNYLGTLHENCYVRSFIDVTNRLYDVADWLGIDTRHDRDLLCEASQKLTKAAEYAQKEGIRFGGVSIQDLDDGNGIVMFMTNPLQFATIRTLEELGLPIVWPGACKDPSCQSWGEVPQSYEVISPALYFPDCPADAIEASCASTPLYKLDFLLLEGYGRKQMQDNMDLFLQTWPDKALLEGQYMAMPYDSFVFSHKSLAGWFHHFADRIYQIKRLHEPYDCTPARVTSNEHVKFLDASLPGGAYACYNKEYHNHEYTTCPAVAVTNSGSDLSAGALAGIVIGSVAGGFILAFLVFKYVVGQRTGIDKGYPSSAADTADKEAVDKLESDSDVPVDNA